MKEPASIFIAMPLYRGTEHVAQALDSIRRQSFAGFKVLISVDGDDLASAEACRPFLEDRRFEMVVHSQRLGWAGNMNFLASRFEGDFFCYWQHDDHCEPNYLERLHRHASLHPEASAIYCDMQVYGEENRVIRRESVTGFALQRVLAQIDDPNVPAIRCLIRSEALRNSVPIHFAGTWVLSLARSGELHRVPELLYHRRSRPDALSFTMPHEPAGVMWRASLDWGTSVAANVLPLIAPGEHLKLLCLVLDRILADKVKAKLKYRFQGTTGKLRVMFIQRLLEEIETALGRSGGQIVMDREELARALSTRQARTEIEALLAQALASRDNGEKGAIEAEYRPAAAR
ncbi:MAG: glycosyltransferase family 2 protein [Nitratireductor sp.]|nr:glycosyltransferase family 2 protein [Nitratireductor sp.]